MEGGDKNGLQEAGGSGIIKKDYDGEFAKKFGKEHYDQICARAEKCPNQDLQKVWAHYEKK